MKFSRIDKDTVRCIITEEDMKEYGLKLEDFFNDKDKSREFLESIVEQAEKEVGYQVKNGVLAIQIMPLPSNGLSITFSENGSRNFMDIFEHIVGATGDGPEHQDFDKMILPKTDNKGKTKTKTIKQPVLKVYRFETLNDVEQYCCSITYDKLFTSQLYKDEKDKSYYLVIYKGRLSSEVFDRICGLAVEFGSFISTNAIYLAYCEEHYQCLIKKKAINVIRNIGMKQA